MNNNEFSNIKITESIEMAIDNSIDEGIERASNEIKSKKINKGKIAIGTIAACLGLLVTFGVINPALAAKLPIVGRALEYIEKNIQFPGNYSEYATSINEKVYDNEIDVTLSDILCDGEGLYVTYIVESKEPFKYTSRGDKQLDGDQLITREEYNKVSFSNKQLDNTGIAGLEGKFIDENTFVGMERYYLTSLGTEIPDIFDFQVKLTSIEISGLTEEDKDQTFNGTWVFKVPVKVDRSISKNIPINYKVDNGFTLDSVMITPFNTLISTSHPNKELCNIRLIDNNNNEIGCAGGNMLDDNKQINYFSALPKNCKSIKVILFKNHIMQKETIRNLDGSCDTDYEHVGDEEILLDKTINIE